MKAKRLLICMAVVLALLMTSAGCGQERAGQSERLLVGAVYYLWYPRNFGMGYLRGRLTPKQLPVLGRYASDDPKVARQHIAWCSAHGIDFLAVDWWPDRPDQNRALDKGLLAAPNIRDIKFCIFYETWQVGWTGGLGATIFDDKSLAKISIDFERLAQKYFNHPSYLKIDGRPVVFLYLSRTFHGKFKTAIAEIRRVIRDQGFEPYIIGDEIFWKVVATKGAGEPGAKGYHPQATSEPQMERIELFDAITSYNMYEGGMGSHEGYGINSNYMKDAIAKLRQYRKLALGAGVGFVPSVLPGYNDRGVRRASRHYIIPRQWQKGGPRDGFLKQSLKQVGFGLLDPALNMIMITSFNEWNEDTQIEPTIPTAPYPTTSKEIWTDGYSYQGYGLTYLRAVRDMVTALHGQVVSVDGEPAPGTMVELRDDGEVVARSRADQQGYYTISRLGIRPGNYRVGAAGAPGRAITYIPSQLSRWVDIIVGRK